MNIIPGAEFGMGNGSIWLDDVSCNEEHKTLTECDFVYPSNGLHDCTHKEDIGIQCGQL